MTKYEIYSKMSITQLFTSILGGRGYYLFVVNRFDYPVPSIFYVETIEGIRDEHGDRYVCRLKIGNDYIYLIFHNYKIIEVAKEPNYGTRIIVDRDVKLNEVVKTFKNYELVERKRFPNRFYISEIAYTRDWFEFRGKWSKKVIVIKAINKPRLLIVSVY